MTINLPDATNVQNVRLTLEKDGSEYSVFKGDLVPNEQQEATARIFSQEAGKYNMRVYINGEFKYQAEVQME